MKNSPSQQDITLIETWVVEVPTKHGTVPMRCHEYSDGAFVDEMESHSQPGQIRTVYAGRCSCPHGGNCYHVRAAEVAHRAIARQKALEDQRYQEQRAFRDTYAAFFCGMEAVA